MNPPAAGGAVPEEHRRPVEKGDPRPGGGAVCAAAGWAGDAPPKSPRSGPGARSAGGGEVREVVPARLVAAHEVVV